MEIGLYKSCVNSNLSLSLSLSHTHTHHLHTETLEAVNLIIGAGWFRTRKRLSRKPSRNFRSLGSLPWSRLMSILILFSMHYMQDLYVKLWFLHQYSTACYSGTAQWKDLVPGSYCSSTRELLNGGWIMWISLSELEALFWVLANSIHCGAHRCLLVMKLVWEEIRRVDLSSGFCLESYKWRMT